MLKAKQKQIQDDKLQREVINCGHEPTLDRLNQAIASREEDIMRVRDRMSNQIKGREREIANTMEKIAQSKVELKRAQKQGNRNMNEGDRIALYERKIQNKEFKCKELEKEIKMLRKL